MNEEKQLEEQLKIWEERHELIQKIGKRRIYVLVFQIVATMMVLALEFFNGLDVVISTVLIVVILVASLILLQIIHRVIVKIIHKPLKEVERYGLL